MLFYFIGYNSGSNPLSLVYFHFLIYICIYYKQHCQIILYKIFKYMFIQYQFLEVKCGSKSITPEVGKSGSEL